MTTLEVAREVAFTIGAAAPDAVELLKTSFAGSKPLNTYGGNYGYGELPLHTDLAHWYRPPRYLLLRCIIGTPTVATRLLHVQQLERWIPTAKMRRALYSPRRRLEGKMYLLRMQTDDLFRWDQLFLNPQNAAAREVSAHMRELEPKLPLKDIVLSRPGQTVLVDNWGVLHGRSAVPLDESHRKLERVYLETSENGKKNTA